MVGDATPVAEGEHECQGCSPNMVSRRWVIYLEELNPALWGPWRVSHSTLSSSGRSESPALSAAAAVFAPRPQQQRQQSLPAGEVFLAPSPITSEPMQALPKSALKAGKWVTWPSPTVPPAEEPSPTVPPAEEPFPTVPPTEGEVDPVVWRTKWGWRYHWSRQCPGLFSARKICVARFSECQDYRACHLCLGLSTTSAP